MFKFLKPATRRDRVVAKRYRPAVNEKNINDRQKFE